MTTYIKAIYPNGETYVWDSNRLFWDSLPEWLVQLVEKESLKIVTKI